MKWAESLRLGWRRLRATLLAQAPAELCACSAAILKCTHTTGGDNSCGHHGNCITCISQDVCCGCQGLCNGKEMEGHKRGISHQLHKMMPQDASLARSGKAHAAIKATQRPLGTMLLYKYVGWCGAKTPAGTALPPGGHGQTKHVSSPRRRHEETAHTFPPMDGRMFVDQMLCFRIPKSSRISATSIIKGLLVAQLSPQH